MKKALLDDDSYDSDISDSSVTMTLTSAEALSPKSSSGFLSQTSFASIEGLKFTKSTAHMDCQSIASVFISPSIPDSSISCFIKPAFFVPEAQDSLQKCACELIETVGEALQHNENPIEAEEGVTGAFLMKKIGGGFAAIFKPEEMLSRRASFAGSSQLASHSPGLKLSDCAVREVTAYILDHDSFARVPETVMVQINWKCLGPGSNHPRTKRISSEIPFNRSHSLKEPSLLNFIDSSDEELINSMTSNVKAGVWKIGSLQKFVDHDDTACDVSWSKFNTEQVHRLGLFDVRVMNTDRHEGNILVKLHEKGNYNSTMDLIPIDHGLILPDYEMINVDGNFCWMSWPQSKEKFSEDSKKYIQNLDPNKDYQQLIRLLGSRLTPRGLFSLKIGTQLLKTAVLKFDLSLQDIGNLIVGDWDVSKERERSPLQVAIDSAIAAVGANDPTNNLLKAFEKELESQILAMF